MKIFQYLSNSTFGKIKQTFGSDIRYDRYRKTYFVLERAKDLNFRVTILNNNIFAIDFFIQMTLLLWGFFGPECEVTQFCTIFNTPFPNRHAFLVLFSEAFVVTKSLKVCHKAVTSLVDDPFLRLK